MDKKKNHVVPLNLKFVLRQGDAMLACAPDQCGGVDSASCDPGVRNVCNYSDYAGCLAPANVDECDVDWGWSCSHANGWDVCSNDNNGSCGGVWDLCAGDPNLNDVI